MGCWSVTDVDVSDIKCPHTRLAIWLHTSWNTLSHDTSKIASYLRKAWDAIESIDPHEAGHIRYCFMHDYVRCALRLADHMPYTEASAVGQYQAVLSLIEKYFQDGMMDVSKFQAIYGLGDLHVSRAELKSAKRCSVQLVVMLAKKQDAAGYTNGKSNLSSVWSMLESLVFLLKAKIAEARGKSSGSGDDLHEAYSNYKEAYDKRNDFADLEGRRNEHGYVDNDDEMYGVILAGLASV